jgi:PadR family transcriptional regulator PadR
MYCIVYFKTYIFASQFMNVENTISQMRKGILEYCILAIISKGEIYASDILAELKEAHLIVVEGTLYPLLTRLKNAGLLTYTWKESLQGPPRKYFLLTTDGAAFLKELDQTWKELNYSVNKTTQK